MNIVIMTIVLIVSNILCIINNKTNLLIVFTSMSFISFFIIFLLLWFIPPERLTYRLIEIREKKKNVRIIEVPKNTEVYYKTGEVYELEKIR